MHRKHELDSLPCCRHAPAHRLQLPEPAIEELSASPSPCRGHRHGLVRVLDSGFVWDGETLSYAFTATNSSEDTSLEETAVQVSIYGKTGEPSPRFRRHRLHSSRPDRGLRRSHPPGRGSRTHRSAFSADQSATVDSARTFDVTDGKFSATGFGGRVVAAIEQPLRSRAQADSTSSPSSEMPTARSSTVARPYWSCSRPAVSPS